MALIAGILCLGFAAIFIKLANTTADLVGAWRMTIGAVVLGVPMLIHWRRGKVRLPRAAIGLLVLGGLAFSLDAFVWSTSVNMTSAAKATLLGNTTPLWVALGSWLLFHEQLDSTYWIGTAVSIVGMILLIGVESFQGAGINPGDLIAMSAGLTYALVQIVTGRARQKIDSLTYTWGFTMISAVLFLSGSSVLGHSLIDLPVRSMLALVGLALVAHVTGWLLISYAFGHIPTHYLSVALLAQPVVTALLAMPILGEFPTLWQILGGMVTLGGIYLVLRGSPLEKPHSLNVEDAQ
ncbi:MAG: DMT family transporter [Anaerolineae bacterium]|nr:DMT family transporter [Anaerolineae bacterium]